MMENLKGALERKGILSHYVVSWLVSLVSLIGFVFVLIWQVDYVTDSADEVLIISEAFSKMVQLLFITGLYFAAVSVFDYFFVSRRFKQIEGVKREPVAVAIYLAGVFIGLGFCIGSSL